MSISTTAEIVSLASKNGFTHGVAWAIAVCMRGGKEGAGERLFTESGMSVQDFENAETEEYDLSQVRIAAGKGR